MVTRDYRLSGRTVTVNIPDNLSQLLIRRDELKAEWLAMKKRIPGTPKHLRIRLNSEISAVKNELAIVNAKISNLDPKGKKAKKSGLSSAQRLDRKINARQKKLEEKGLTAFPRFGSDADKFSWAIAQLNLAIGLLNNENRTELSDEDLISSLGDGFSYMTNCQKLDELEAEQAKQDFLS